jgi:acetyltransferase
MSIRNLDPLFDPASVAVIGASPRPNSVGATVWRNLRSGSYRGRVFAVNPKHRELDGEPVYASPADLPCAPELALICTPPASVASLIGALGTRGTRAAIVLSAGLDATQRQAMLDAARPHLLRILGPNCIGMLSPHLGLNASFAPSDALAGELAFVSQSGALVTAMLDWARARGIGFSHVISLGEHADVDFADLLDVLASDARTRAILLYIESISMARKFMSAARAAARNKPVIVVKAGRSAPGQRAATSHTGALAGSDAVFDAAIRRAGMLRVDTLGELFLAAETLTRFRANTAQQLIVLTNGGGAGVMAADAAAAAGVELAGLDADTLARLDRVLPANWSRANPIDIIGDAPVARYVHALEALQAGNADAALLFIHAPTAIVPSGEIAQALLPLARSDPPRLMSCWLGETAVAQARATFQQAGIPSYATPEDAVRAFSLLVTYRHNQAQLLETPRLGSSMQAAPDAQPHAPGAPSKVAPSIDTARSIVRSALAAGSDWLSESDAKTVLAAFGIPTVATRETGTDVGAVLLAAREIGFPIALKILSPDIVHKSEIGGVLLDLDNEAALSAAAHTLLERVAQLRPDARVDGFTVQACVRRRHATELIVGASVDPVFGPVVLFGQGGTAVEVVADRAIALPPLNEALARALVSRTRVARLLDGFRDTPAVDLAALCRTLVAVSQLLAELPEVAELDINPLLANPDGVLALDARMRVSAAAPSGASRFAIRPYPAELTEVLDWRDQSITLRPIRPEDEAQHREFLTRLDPQDVRLRVFYSRRSIEHSELARLTQIDYEREMAFLAVLPGPAGVPEQTLGVVRAVADPDNISAEFGILVRSDLKGQGLGKLLMDKLIGYLRDRGVQRLVASVLRENRPMLDLAHALGFVRATPDPGGETVDIELRLAGGPDSLAGAASG